MWNRMPYHVPLGLAVFAVSLLWATGLPATARGWQGNIPVPAQRGLPMIKLFDNAVQADVAQDETAAKDDENVSRVDVIENTSDVDPHEVRFHMWDGSIIAGELDISNLTVTTEFGQLTVPVDRIVKLRPGLLSYPEKKREVDTLVDQLGSPDFKTRESAKQQLLAMGRLLHRAIYEYGDADNAERKRHLEEIRKEFEQQMDDFEDDLFVADTSETPWIQGDSVETPDFVIVGKIDQSDFSVTSKYGKLRVDLADVRFVDRDQPGSVVRRTTVTVNGKNFAHSDPKSTGIRVERGDRIQIRASGQLTMSPWGNQAVVQPDGNTGYGNFNGHGGGTLLAVIGDSAEYIKVGSRASFVATKSGLLKLGVAIQSDYANPSYEFPGQYQAKIVVESPATK